MQNLLLLSELQESEGRFNAAFQSSAIGMGLLTLEGRILHVNDVILKISGYAGEELLQQYERDHVHPDDRELGREMHQELLEGKRELASALTRSPAPSARAAWVRFTALATRSSSVMSR